MVTIESWEGGQPNQYILCKHMCQVQRCSSIPEILHFWRWWWILRLTYYLFLFSVFQVVILDWDHHQAIKKTFFWGGDWYWLKMIGAKYYCWWLKSSTTWDVWNPTNNGINYLSTGAGFQPSTVLNYSILKHALRSLPTQSQNQDYYIFGRGSL